MVEELEKKNFDLLETILKVEKESFSFSQHLILVRNMPIEINENDLQQIFHEWSPKSILSLKICSSKSSAAFISFSNETDMYNAFAEMNASEVNGQTTQIFK